MGDRIRWLEDCPNCGAKGSLECYEQLTSNIKSEDCEKCGYYVPYDVDDSGGVITITKGEPYVRKTGRNGETE